MSSRFLNPSIGKSRGIKLALAAVALPVVAFFAIACSGDDNGDTPSGGASNPQPTWTAAPSSSGSAPPTATAVAGTPGTCGPTGSEMASLNRDNVRVYSAYPPTVIDATKQYTAVVQTSKGTITMELRPDKAPLTVNSFVYLSCRGYYDGLSFHRVVASFVIQGGDPKGDGTGGPGYVFKNEISDLKHDAIGTLAMARTNQPDTNGSQFYITLATNAQTANLDGSYTVFGKVTAGLEVVANIKQGDKILAISITEQ